MYRRNESSQTGKPLKVIRASKLRNNHEPAWNNRKQLLQQQGTQLTPHQLWQQRLAGCTERESQHIHQQAQSRTRVTTTTRAHTHTHTPANEAGSGRHHATVVGPVGIDRAAESTDASAPFLPRRLRRSPTSDRCEPDQKRVSAGVDFIHSYIGLWATAGASNLISESHAGKTKLRNRQTNEFTTGADATATMLSLHRPNRFTARNLV